LDRLFREEIHKWAAGGNLRHLLNDPDDNRDNIPLPFQLGVDSGFKDVSLVSFVGF
jgi:hypothetical protein